MPAKRPLLLATVLAPALLLAGEALSGPGPRPDQAVSAATASATEASPSETARLLAEAIRERRVVTFHYAGRLRTLEPHTCGVGSTGEEILHGYQIEGESASGARLGWRTFTVAKISDLTVQERRFAAGRPGYATSRPRLSPAWAELPSPTESPAP